MRLRPIMLILAAASAAVITYSLVRPRVNHPSDASTTVRRPSALDAVQPATSAIGSQQRTAAVDPDRLTREAAGGGLAVIRGRVVDQEGRPLDGAAVSLRGSRASSDRLERYRLEHGEVEWDEPEDLVTDRDGRFELRFDPPPPYRFSISVDATGFVQMSASWNQVDRGATIDIGELVLPRGVVVNGRVVDQEGVGVGNERVSLRRANSSRSRTDGEFRLRSADFAWTDAAGFFSLDRAFAPGDSTVEVTRRRVRAPDGPVALALPSADLRIVVETLVGDDEAVIAGLVVDERGVPLTDFKIRATIRMSGLRTGRDGRFRARFGPSADASGVRLTFTADGYEAHQTPDPIALGTADLHVVLRDGPPLTIHVRRASDGAPVERFGVLLARSGGLFPNLEGLVLEHRGAHPNGILEIPRVSTGRYRVSVVPDDSTGLSEGVNSEVSIEDGVHRVLEFRLDATAERELIVVTASGKPLANVRVELLENMAGREVTLQMRATSLVPALESGSDTIAVRHDAADTDADGRAVVCGRGGHDLALRLPGPGHVPTILQRFRTDGEGPVRVVVAEGAALRGRIEPPELVAVWREETGYAPRAGSRRRGAGLGPGIRLVGTGDQRAEVFPDKGVATIEDDGSFSVTGVPPGVWDLYVWSVYQAAGSPDRTESTRCAAAALELADGEERVVVLDLVDWVRHDIGFEVRVDDRPFEGRLQLDGVLGLRPDGQPHREQRFVITDRDGRARAGLPAGYWTPGVWATVAERFVMLPGTSFAVGAESDGAVRVDLHLASRAIVVLDPEGRPVPDLEVLASTAPVMARVSSAPTDLDGRTVLHGPPVTVALRVRRKPLLDAQSWSEWTSQHRGNREARDRAFVEVGAVDLVVVGGGGEHTIRLPAEWAETAR